MSAAERDYPALTQEEFEDTGQTFGGVVLVTLGDDGEHIAAWGHVDPSTMAAAVTAYDVEICGDPDPDPDETIVDEVGYVYAVVEQPPTAPEGWCIRWGSHDTGPVSADEPGAFPLTVVSR